MSYRKRPRDTTRPTPRHRTPPVVPSVPAPLSRLGRRVTRCYLNLLYRKAHQRLLNTQAMEREAREFEAQWRRFQDTSMRDSKWGSNSWRFA